MKDGNAKAKRLRERADQIRVISFDVRSADDRRTLRAIAKELEKMAAAAARAKP